MDEENKEKNLSIPELEQRVIEIWEREDTFKKSLEKTKGGEPFTFYDGPPFATGLPHYGHILASTIKDVIPRYQTMRGRYVRRRWGWDCHGLPIEEIVERELKISGKKQIEEVGIAKFNETCRAMVLQFADEWRKMIRRMGRWVDFDNSYKTMDRTFMESVWWAFKQLYDKGLVYEGRKVLLYCPRCETPVSNFEVAMDNSYKDVTEEAVFVKFKLRDPSVILSVGVLAEVEGSLSLRSDAEIPRQARDDKGGNVSLLAWTTTPWTLPGNVALAVGSDIAYVAAKTGEEIVIVAAERAASVLPSGYEVVQEMKGSDLVGLAYEPLFTVPEMQTEKAYKVYAADFVTTTEGTGIVHTAVVYGEDDYQLGLHEGLPAVPLLDEKGHFNEKAPELVRGQYFKKAEKAVKDDLAARHLLFAAAPHTHSYPHCWRCGTALYYNAIPAWFVNVRKIKGGLLASNEKEVNWFPEHLKRGRYQKSVEAAPDWNISRNRYWGNPIPVWKCADCAAVKVAGSIADLGLPKTTFYFLRHGESEINVDGIITSFPEAKEHALTAAGRDQAKRTGALLAKEGVDAVYASPLLRTKETGEIIASLAGKEATVDHRLREFDLGVWNGRTWKEFDTTLPKTERWSKGPEGGETYRDIQARMLEFVNEAALKHPGGKVVVVSHGDPLMLVLKYFGNYEGYPAYAEPVKIEVDLTDLHRPYIDMVTFPCEQCGGVSRRVPEIFDSWVEAGSMPFAEFHYPFENKAEFEARYPAQFVAEYIAQTRAWFYVMHVMGYSLFGKAPFDNVVTTGTILAEDGSKMSKSKKNYPDPWAVIEKYGVDSLRFYLMNSVVMQADNLNFSEKDLGTTHRKVTMLLWNVYQYYKTYAPTRHSEPDEESSLPHSAEASRDKHPKHVLDVWINARTKELVREATTHLDGYDTVRATRAIEAYIDDLSTWYLRRSRGRTDPGFFPTFRETLVTVSQIIAPFMPHIAEAIYQGLQPSSVIPAPRQSEASGEGGEAGIQRPSSVHLSDWPKVEEVTEDEKKLLEEMSIVREAASVGLAWRKSANIPVKQPLAQMEIGVIEPAWFQLYNDIAQLICEEVNVKKVSIVSSLTTTKDPSIPGNHYLSYARLDSNLTPELRIEGLTRQLERFVQEMRKTAGFKVGEQAMLLYETADPDIEQALAQFNKEKAYLSAIEKGQVEGGAAFESDGKSGRFSLRRK